MAEKALTSRQKTDAFLEHLASNGNVSQACRASGLSRSWVYKRRKTSKKFDAAWIEAEQQAVDALLLEARARALTQSDTLMIFLLKHLAPEKFSEKHVHEHHHSGQVNHDHTHRAVEEQLSEFNSWLDATVVDEADGNPPALIPD